MKVKFAGARWWHWLAVVISVLTGPLVGAIFLVISSVKKWPKGVHYIIMVLVALKLILKAAWERGYIKL